MFRDGISPERFSSRSTIKYYFKVKSSSSFFLGSLKKKNDSSAWLDLSYLINVANAKFLQLLSTRVSLTHMSTVGVTSVTAGKVM